VKAFFSSSTGLASEHGIAKRIYDFTFGALGVNGNVSTHSSAFQKSIDQNNATIDKFNLHIAAYQKQLLAQYTALDTNMSKLNSLSTYVSQQLAQWNKTS
jgi:flagellar hook-associated protein 2